MRCGGGFRLVGTLLATMLALLAAPAAGAAAAPKVLVAGDSLEVLTSPHLSRYLPGVELTINAVGGYNSYQIFDLFEESYDPSQSVVVFDAGTNDNPEYPQILEGNLAEVAATVGDRCLVVPTVHGYTVNGVDNTGKNRVVARFAASRPGTQVPDWAATVATQPELVQFDGLHPTEEGADYRAQLIAQGVEGCLAYDRARSSSASAGAEGSSAPPPEVEPIAHVGRLAARSDQVMEAIRAGVVRKTAASLLSSLF